MSRAVTPSALAGYGLDRSVETEMTRAGGANSVRKREPVFRGQIEAFQRAGSRLPPADDRVRAARRHTG
jgi:hypothetical protein